MVFGWGGGSDHHDHHDHHDHYDHHDHHDHHSGGKGGKGGKGGGHHDHGGKGGGHHDHDYHDHGHHDHDYHNNHNDHHHSKGHKPDMSHAGNKGAGIHTSGVQVSGHDALKVGGWGDTHDINDEGEEGGFYSAAYQDQLNMGAYGGTGAAMKMSGEAMTVSDTWGSGYGGKDAAGNMYGEDETHMTLEEWNRKHLQTHQPKVERGNWFYICLNYDGAPFYSDCLVSTHSMKGVHQMGDLVQVVAKAHPGRDGRDFIMKADGNWVLEIGERFEHGVCHRTPLMVQVKRDEKENLKMQDQMYTVLRRVNAYLTPCVFTPHSAVLNPGASVRFTECISYKLPNKENVVMMRAYKNDPLCPGGWVPQMLPGKLCAVSASRIQHCKPPVWYLCNSQSGVACRTAPSASLELKILDARVIHPGELVESQTIVEHEVTKEVYIQIFNAEKRRMVWLPSVLVNSEGKQLNVMESVTWTAHIWAYKCKIGQFSYAYAAPSWFSPVVSKEAFQKGQRLLAREIVDAGWSKPNEMFHQPGVINKKEFSKSELKKIEKMIKSNEKHGGLKKQEWIRLAPPLEGWSPVFNKALTGRLLEPVGGSEKSEDSALKLSALAKGDVNAQYGILNKSGPISFEETIKMQKHVVLEAQMRQEAKMRERLADEEARKQEKKDKKRGGRGAADKAWARDLFGGDIDEEKSKKSGKHKH